MSKTKKEQPEITKPRFQNVEITLIEKQAVEVEFDEKGRRKGLKPSFRANNEPNFERSDFISLQSLLMKFDTTKHPPRQWAFWSSIKQKITDAYIEGRKKLVLTLDEAAFLKDFLVEFPKEEGKERPIVVGEAAVRAEILAQLGA